MTPRQVLNSHSSKELSEWIAYNNIDPFGNMRGDIQAGIISSTMANLWADEKTKPDDFIPEFKGVKEKQNWSEQKRIAEMLNTAFGGKTIG